MISSNKALQSTFTHLNNALASHRILQAIGHLDTLADLCRAPWQLRDDIEKIRQSYSLLSGYAINGFDDPQRASVLADINSGIRQIAASIARFSEIPDSPRQYFSIIRYERLQPDSSIPSLLIRYESDYNEQMRKMLFSSGVSQTADQSIDLLARRIFNLIWTSYPLTAEDSSAILSSLQNESIPDHFKLLLVSALSLGGLEYFGEERLIILSRIYLSLNQPLAMRALVGMLLNMWIHRDLLTGRRLRDAVNTVKEHPSWLSDLRMAYMELVRTRDTERISRKLRDEIIPEMMKMRPDILNNLKSVEDAEEMMSLEENPEWAEMLEKSGLNDKLKELNDLQSDGSDVMMSTFSNLKSFSFFNEPANWFLPFYSYQADIAEILDDSASDIAQLISTTPAICDSDKYSIVLSLRQIPTANRRMMLSQFKLNDINLSELRSSDLNPEGSDRVNYVNKYIQDLYRFFNLYRRKGEFNNPFSSPINLASIDLLADSLRDSDILDLIGEFYFKRGYYPEALNVFRSLRQTQTPSAQMLQKIGYCLQQTGDIAGAITAYEQSRMLRPDSLWTLRRLAQCYRLVGNNESALICYREIERQKPDDTSVALNLGHCLLSLGNIEEALKCYYKVEYLSGSLSKALRPIAWCLFVSGDFNRSLEYYQKVLADNPDATDYLNAGHLQMALKNYREAVNFYRLSIENSRSKAPEDFLSSLNSDRPQLIKAGVDPLLIDIVADAVFS